MDFKHVIEKLLAAFREHDIRYALMGGMALGAWGVPRGTVDIDFLVNRDDMEKVDGIMKGLGYERRYHSENVSQYMSSLRIFGEVDFLHALRKHSLSMLDRTVVKQMFGGTLSINVLKVEDLIGFKLQGMVNNESRQNIDLPDIESLMAANRKILDWNLIREYFDIFNRINLFNELKGKYGND